MIATGVATVTAAIRAMLDGVAQAVVETTTRVPPPVGVVVAFGIGYLAVGIPAHFRFGGVSRDVYGTLAGLFVALGYLALVLGLPRQP